MPWCEEFSPSVGVDATEPPESLLFDVTGLDRLFHGASEKAPQKGTDTFCRNGPEGALHKMYLSPFRTGEETLVAHVGREFSRRGLSTRIVLADTIGAAWAVAHYQEIANCELRIANCKLAVIVPPGKSRAAIAPLPVAALRLSANCVETLHELGLRQIGQLFSFSRDSLAARFGPELLLRLDQATGAVAEVIAACHPLPHVEAETVFEYPTDRPEIIQQALERQLDQIVRQLSPRREGVQELVCRFRGETGKAGEFTVGLYRPSAQPRHLAELIELEWQAARRKLVEPIASLHLAVTAAAPLELHQQELFDDDKRHYDPRQTAMLVDRLSSRLGRNAVVRPRLIADAQPELAWRYEPLVGGPKRRPSLTTKKGPTQRPTSLARPACRWPLTRPLSLAQRPLPLDVVSMAPQGPPQAFSLAGEQHRLHRVWGPERIQTGWWRGRSVRRDYYRVETITGRWFWLFRQLTDGRWYFHGAFD